jgi:transcription antitermination factor NusG
MSPNWYAVRTRANSEKQVNAQLREKGFETYLPVFRQQRQWKDRRKLVEFPIFPGYLFTRMIDQEDCRLSVLRTAGAVRILSLGDRLEPIPDQQIVALQQMVSAGPQCFVHPLLKEGCWVRVRRGPLKNLEGLLIRFKNQTRLVLSIALVCQSISAEVEASDVEYLRSAGQISRHIA